MKKGSFDDRVAKCLAQFRDVETRSSERSERQGLNHRIRRDADHDKPSRKG